LTPNPWSNEILCEPRGFLATLRLLRGGNFDRAILGPNSFRSALLARLSASRASGFARDGRSFLLADRIEPLREKDGRLSIVSALDYYLLLAEHLGCPSDDKRMELFVADADAHRADELLAKAEVADGRPLVLLNPGASFGSSKIYPSERLAKVADELVRSRGAQILINAGPGEGPIAGAVEASMQQKIALNLAKVENSLGLLKAIVRRCRLMITNDTGPRHIAAALGVPVVAIFGSPHPGWSHNYFDKERIVRVDVPCGPCQQKTCPLPADQQPHQCMRLIEPQMVLAAALELLDER
jgi:heptosyltransferase II